MIYFQTLSSSPILMRKSQQCNLYGKGSPMIMHSIIYKILITAEDQSLDLFLSGFHLEIGLLEELFKLFLVEMYIGWQSKFKLRNLLGAVLQ